jgi:urease accessory protein
VADGNLGVSALYEYCKDVLQETLLVDAVYCRQAHNHPDQVLELNDELSALRPAREMREASLALGKRFFQLLSRLDAVELPVKPGHRVHLCLAFGCVATALGFDADRTVGAFLHQTVLMALSTAQRLLPLGQVESSMLAWDLKPEIEAAVQRSGALNPGSVTSFSHLPELAGMRHSFLSTRLFIS